jgi:hypothetical protein
MTASLSLITFAGLVLLTGCMPEKVDYSARPATSIDPKTKQLDFWFDKPAVASVQSADYDVLWDAAARTLHDYSFYVDLTDYREGKLTSHPLTSKMPFEFWKHDVVDPHSQLECSLSTMRHTAQFLIHKLDDGQYVCEPKVVVEHYAMPERRITSVIEYQEAFSIQRPAINGASDEGVVLQVEYWYAVARDEALERAMADSMRQMLARTTQSARSAG